MVSIALILFLLFVSSAGATNIGRDLHNFTIPDPHNLTIPSVSNGTGDPTDDQIVSEESTLKSNMKTALTVSAAPKLIEDRITLNESWQQAPAVYGNKIVWQDDRNGNYDVYIQDLSTKKQVHTTNSAEQCCPGIYNNKVVYMDNRNGNWDIYMYDLSTSKEKRITTDGSDHYYPAIYGNRIVWNDYRNGNSDIYMYDLSKKKGDENYYQSIIHLFPRNLR